MQNFLLAALLAILPGVSWAEPPHSVSPKDGFVPTAEVAIRIAVAVWEPIYGAANIERQKPYRATLANGVWTVEGSLPPQSVGGVALAEISQSDARILRVSHGQ
jgi:hypothetical protein